MSKLHNVSGIEIQIPSTSGETPNVRVVISRSRNRFVDELRYRESENLLKKLLKNLCKNKRKSIPKVKGQKTIFLFIKEFGRTCQRINSVADAAVKPKSRNLPVDWYDMSIREKERQMEQFIGNSFVQSS